jgi:drug/metabolite transporter (DMT)-like permease
LSNALKGHIALFLAQVIYALNYSIAKGLMPTFISPMSIVFFRLIGACILFWLLSLFVKIQKVEKKDLIKMAWLSLAGMVFNQVFFIFGLSITTPINSSIIMISNPIMVFIFTLFLLRERISIAKFSGLCMAVIGAFMILRYRGNFEVGSDTIVGDILTFGNAALWGIFIVTAKPIMQKYDTITAMCWMFLFASLFIIPMGISSALKTDFSIFTPHAIFGLGFVIVATTFLAYLLNVYGLEVLSPNTVSAYIYLQPFLASLFAIMMNEDKMTPTKLFSGLLIISGLFLINKKPKKTAT